jgi:hypothetical protein
MLLLAPDAAVPVMAVLRPSSMLLVAMCDDTSQLMLARLFLLVQQDQ